MLAMSVQLHCMKAVITTIITVSLLVFSCATTTLDPIPENLPSEQPAEPESTPEPAPEIEPAETPEDETFEVSQEVYDQTHNEIQELIEKLNSVISKRDYEGWLRYLSPKYKDTYSSKETLNDINQSPLLKDNGIVLKNLNDYFDWVIVPSRSRAVLNEIVFVDENKVIAYSSYSGKRARLYELERIGGRWLVSEWE